MYYVTRNKNNIAKLAPRTRAAAEKLLSYAMKKEMNVLIYETTRTVEKQRDNIRNGVSQTMKSYHIVGQALDFVFIDENGKERWNGYYAKDVQDFVQYAKGLGFTWGGDWSSFRDCPHLQYTYKGYGTDTGKAVTTVSTAKGNISPKGKFKSLVDYLKAHNMNSSFAGRSVLAKQKGIKGYTGTAAQNIKLLNMLQG